MKNDDIPQAFLGAWPDCARRGCPNKCCLALHSRYCWPQTRGPQRSLEEIIAARDLIAPELEQEPHYG